MKILKPTIFKKVFLIIFCTMIIIEVIYYQKNYNANLASNASSYYSDEQLQEFENIALEFKEDLTDEKFLNHFEQAANELYGYYAIYDTDNDVIAENYKSYYIDEAIEPIMIITHDDKDYTIDLSQISSEQLERLEENIEYNNLGYRVSGKLETKPNEETEEMDNIIYASYLADTNILEVPYIDGEEENAIEGVLTYYASQNIRYTRDEIINYKDLKQMCRNVIKNIDETKQIISVGSLTIRYKVMGDKMAVLNTYPLFNENVVPKGYVCWCYIDNDISYIKEVTFNENKDIYLISLVLSIVVSILISLLFTRRIKKIDKITQKITHDDYNHQINIKSKDEIGDLSLHINEMCKHLKDIFHSLNEEIRHNKYLESTKEQFTANFTHEIKTPLAIMNGYIELIETNPDDEKRQEYLNAIETEINKVNELVLGMLNLSKLESGNIELNIQEIDVDEMISHVLENFDVILKNKRLKVDIETELPIIKADEKYMKMVFKNMIHNAIKHTPEFGHIYISYKDGELYIENMGSHLTDHQKEHIWDTYVSSDREGTGLGLAICKMIFDMHNFGYDVYNTTRGVCFKIEFHK